MLAAVLALDGALHVYWSSGLTWPAADARTLSLALLGFAVPFTKGLLWALAALLWSSAALVLLHVRLRSGPSQSRRILHGTTAVVLIAVTSALLLRAVLGCWWCFAADGLDPSFYRLNLLLYTPGCVVLACCGLLLLRPGTGAGEHSRWRRVLTTRTASIVTPTLVFVVLIALAYGSAPAPQTGYEPRSALGAVASRYVDTPLARFHYIRAGHGSPVVLLSPGSAWVFAWLPQFRALAATHTVYAVDLPGQGFTRLHDRGFAFDLEAMTNAISSFLDAENLPEVALAGNSWSGGWALAFAQRHPERVNRLLLLAPSGLVRPDPTSWELLKLPLVGAALANLSAGSRQLTEAGVRPLFAHRDRITPDLLTAFWAPNTFPDNLRATVRLEQHLDWGATQRALPETQQPTMVLWGRADTVLPVDQAATFAAALPHGDVHVLDQCGHALTLDCPGRVSRLMMDFLDDR